LKHELINLAQEEKHRQYTKNSKQGGSRTILKGRKAGIHKTTERAFKESFPIPMRLTKSL